MRNFWSQAIQPSQFRIADDLHPLGYPDPAFFDGILLDFLAAAVDEIDYIVRLGSGAGQGILLLDAFNQVVVSSGGISPPAIRHAEKVDVVMLFGYVEVHKDL